MIVAENTADGRVRHWSDLDVMIRQVETGRMYQDAVDRVPCRYTYEETDEPISDEPTTEDKAEAYDILVGVSQ